MLTGVISAVVLFFVVDEIRWIRRDNEYRRFPLRRWFGMPFRRAIEFFMSS